MLDTIRDGFDSIFNFFKSILDFVSLIVNGFLSLFKLIPQAANAIQSVTFCLPPFILTFFLLTIALLIVKLILDLL